MGKTRQEKINLVIGAQDKTKSVLSSISKQIIGIGAAYLTFNAGLSLIKDIVNAGKEHEKIWRGVEASLERHGLQVDTNIKKIKDFSDEMQTLSGVSDEVIGDSVRMFVDYGNSVDKSMNLVTTAMDLATGANINYKSAVDLLAKASTGYTSMLSRYGIIVDQSLSSSEKFNEALKQINDRFGGATQAQAETYAVKLDVLGQRFGDLEESIFKLAAPALTDGVSFLADIIGELVDSFKSEPIINVDKELASFNDTSASTTERMRQLNEQYERGELALENYGDAFANAMSDLKQIQEEELNPLELHDKELKDRFEQLVAVLKQELYKGLISYDEFNARLIEGVNAVSGKLSTFTYTNTAELWKIADEAKGSAESIIASQANAFVQASMMTKTRSEMLANALAYDESQEEDHWNSIAEKDEEEQNRRIERLRLGLTEQEYTQLEFLNREYENQLIHDDLMLEQAKIHAALKLGISVEALEEMLDKDKEAIDKTKEYISKYARQLEGDFRLSIHRIVSDTDKGVHSMKRLWGDLGRSVRSIIVDMIIDALVKQIGAIFSGVIPALAGEAIATKALTEQYKRLGIVKAFTNPTQLPAMISAGTGAVAALESLTNVPGFDDSINDFEAFKHGRDYMRKVKEGMAFENSGSNFGRDFVNMSPIQQGGGSVTYQTTIHINGDSNINDETIQKIEDAVVRGTSRIALNRGSLTSRTGARY